MTKTNQPNGASSAPGRTETDQPAPLLHERVRQRMRKMASVALVAATPLANTACDPPPPPPICDKSPADWIAYDLSGTLHGAWGQDAGDRIVLLTLGVDGQSEVRLPASYTIVGGSFLPTSSLQPNQLRIKPDAGATAIVLQGTMTCEQRSAPIRITIDLVPPDGGSVNAPPPVKVALQS
jgi:hypothetical protein